MGIKCKHASESLWDFVKQIGWAPRSVFFFFFKQDRYSLITYISNKFPGDVNAAGPRTVL